MPPALARLSPQAAAWLRTEVAYLAARNPAAARSLLERLRTARRTLAEHPAIGPLGLLPGTRCFVVSPYVLTYRQRGGVLEIVALRHAHQADAWAPREERPPESPEP